MKDLQLKLSIDVMKYLDELRSEGRMTGDSFSKEISEVLCCIQGTWNMIVNSLELTLGIREDKVEEFIDGAMKIVKDQYMKERKSKQEMNEIEKQMGNPIFSNVKNRVEDKL